jgi:hypothetical protein
MTTTTSSLSEKQARVDDVEQSLSNRARLDHHVNEQTVSQHDGGLKD